MKNKHLAVLLMIAVGFAPLGIAHAQSGQNTRAGTIIDRNIDRQEQIEDRNITRLQDIEDRQNARYQTIDTNLEDDYLNRFIPHLDATSQDIQATLMPIETVLINITDRMNNIYDTLVGLNIQTVATNVAVNYPDPFFDSVSDFNIEEKLENFTKCFGDLRTYPDTSNHPDCIVYDIPASNVEADRSGLKQAATQPLSASLTFMEQLEKIAGDMPAGDPRKVRFISQSNPPSVMPQVGPGFTKGNSTTFNSNYTSLGEFAELAGLISIDEHDIDCSTVNPPSSVTCEFIDPAVYRIVAQNEANRLRLEIQLLQGTMTNVRQAIRAFVFDVQEAIEFQRRIQDSYDPLNGGNPYENQGPAYDPRERRGSGEL